MKAWILSSTIFLLSLSTEVQAVDTHSNDATSLSSSVSSEKALNLKNVKPKPNPAYDRESSSYMGDPDPLDPLKVKNESIKEDEEPILNEIRNISNVPEDSSQQTLMTEPTPQLSTNDTNDTSAGNNEEIAKPKAKTVVKKKKSNNKKKKTATTIVRSKKVSAKKSKVYESDTLFDDDADLGLERKFHQVYKKYNSRPTSEKAWSRVTGEKKSHVYIVQPGDTLWSISGVLFGDKFFWPKLWAVNRQGIENPHQIEPGLRVNFYPGEEGEVPGLELNDGSASDVLTDGEEIESSDIAASKKVRKESGKVRSHEATPLPDSLPLWANKKYFEKGKKIQIDLGENINVVTEAKSNIILSGEKLLSEFNIPLEQISRGGRCDAGVIYKKIEFEEGQHPAGEYIILQPLDQIETSKEQVVHPYEIMGFGNVAQTQFNVHECHALMTTNFVFVRKEKLDLVRNQSIPGEHSSEIIGGADLGDQKLFAVDQLVYLSLGNSNVSNGQIVNLRSQVNDKTNAQVKILDRFGNYAVGVLTQVTDLVEKGDAVVY